MLSAFLGSSSEIIQVGEDDLSQIMKNVCHGALESGTNILEAKRHDTICKSTPRGSECGFVLIGWVNLNLVVARETVHEGQSLVANTIIDNLVDKGCWKIVFGTSVIEITKVCTDMDSACFLLTGTGLETHDVYAMGYMNPAVRNLSISALMAATLDGCNGHCFCRTGVISGHVSI
jgi:hypothetical protein